MSEVMPNPDSVPVAVPAPVSAPKVVVSDVITYDDFMKVKLRVGKILEASVHPNADKLCVLKVDLGEKTVQIVAGIKQYYAPETLVGKLVAVVVNLAPRALRGVESQGMILAASTADGAALKLLTLDAEISVGSVIK